jgi:hypothetical protein
MRQAEAEAAGAVVPSISATRNSQNAVPAYDDDDAPEPRASFFIGPGDTGGRETFLKGVRWMWSGFFAVN